MTQASGSATAGKVTSGAMGTQCRSSTTAASAKPPPSIQAATRSPTCSDSTPGPVCSMIPATSWPIAAGSLSGALPVQRSISEVHRPHCSMRINAWPAPSGGSVRSINSTRNGSCNTAAFIGPPCVPEARTPIKAPAVQIGQELETHQPFGVVRRLFDAVLAGASDSERHAWFAGARLAVLGGSPARVSAVHCRNAVSRTSGGRHGPVTESLRVAVVGTGEWWGYHHARVWPNALTSTWSRSSVGRREDRVSGSSAFGVPALCRPRMMLDAERPDLVSLCLPNEGHYETTLQVIRAGFPLFVEKPITFDLAEADSLIEEAASRGSVLRL